MFVAKGHESALASVLNHPLVHPYIFSRRLVPGEVLRHAALHDPGPLLLITEGAQCASQCIHQCPRTIAPELETVASTVGLLVDGVFEAASSANHRGCAVLQAVDLMPPT